VESFQETKDTAIDTPGEILRQGHALTRDAHRKASLAWLLTDNSTPFNNFILHLLNT
jgi:hypothetical protein